jgi:hypothetical protein
MCSFAARHRFVERSENDHFHGDNTCLKWLIAAPRVSLAVSRLNVRNIPVVEVSRLTKASKRLLLTSKPVEIEGEVVIDYALRLLEQKSPTSSQRKKLS